MKHIKKMAGVLLALAMLVCLAIPAFANDDTYTITIDNTASGHTYMAYQILTGDLSGTTLSNIKWGTGIVMDSDDNSSDLLSALQSAEALKTSSAYDFSGVNTAQGVADVLTNGEKDYNNTSDTSKLRAFADVVAEHLTSTKTDSVVVKDSTTQKITGYTISVTSPGYYLIKDTFTDTSGTPDDSLSSYILKVTQETDTISPKNAKPTVTKEVLDETTNEGETDKNNDGWGATADHNIGEQFKFRLTASIPDDKDFDDYDTYKLIFNDTMSKGITYGAIESVTFTSNDNTEVILTEKSSSTGDYTATTGTATDPEGTTLTVTIDDLKSVKDSSNNAINIKGGKVTVVYTAKLNENAIVGYDSNKSDPDKYNKNTVNLQYSNNPNSSSEMGKTPDTNVYVFTWELPIVKYKDSVADGNKLQGAGFRLYSDESCTTEIKMAEIKNGSTVTGYRPAADSSTTSVEMISGSDGSIKIEGLDAGTYYLKETTTPSGYNDCANVKITIKADHSASTGGVASATESVYVNESNTAATDNTVNIINYSGSTLPSTGGIGTTIFYVVGGALAVCAGVLLVTKKRMGE